MYSNRGKDKHVCTVGDGRLLFRDMRRLSPGSLKDICVSSVRSPIAIYTNTKALVKESVDLMSSVNSFGIQAACMLRIAMQGRALELFENRCGENVALRNHLNARMIKMTKQ